MRLNALIEYNLIEHHQVRNPRREWYEITEKGREIFGLLLKMLEVKDQKVRADNVLLVSCGNLILQLFVEVFNSNCSMYNRLEIV